MNIRVNFADLRTAFYYKDNQNLKFTWLVFKLFQYPLLVKLLGGIATLILKYHLPFRSVIKNTVFRIFCSGENEAEAFGTIHMLHQYNVKSVLDYVSEGESNDAAFNCNTEKIIRNISTIMNGEKTDLISVKLSGLENPEFLTQINTRFSQLEGNELLRWERFRQRVDRICEAGVLNNVMVYIDAEESWFQDVIDAVAEEMMRKYNEKKVYVFNTLQMYRTDRITYLTNLLQRALKCRYLPGIKLVRGAYIEKEAREALKKGIPNPVFANKEDTDLSFNEAVRVCLKNHHFVSTCIATHNEESIQCALDFIAEFQVSNHQQKVQFSQLYGMSDNLTFNLASEGFHASKYLPYGEVEKAIPYLIRRAEENSGVSGQMSREFELLERELKRRENYYAYA